MAVKTLSDLTLVNNNNVVDFGISDLFTQAPVLAALAAVPASAGNTHSYRKLVGEASTGFRPLNDGLVRSAAQYQQIDEILKFLDTQTAPIDSAWLKGQKNPSGEMLKEVQSSIRSGFQKFEQQIFETVDSNGFTSLSARFNLNTNAHVIDAGGTGSNLTSIYLIYSTDDNRGVAAVLGNGQSINVDPSYHYQAQGTNGLFDAVVTPGGAWVGLQVGSSSAVVRIANIDLSAAPNAAHAATGTKIFNAIATKFPYLKPTMLVMRPETQEQIRAGRTATSPTGADAETPTQIANVNIITTSAISANETVVGAS